MDEKTRLGLEKDAIRLEKEGLVARQLGSKRANLGRSASVVMGAGGSMRSTPEQRQQAADLFFAETNLQRAEQLFGLESKKSKNSPMYNNRPLFFGSAMANKPSAISTAEQTLKAAQADVQRAKSGQRPLLQELKLPETPVSSGLRSLGFAGLYNR